MSITERRVNMILGSKSAAMYMTLFVFILSFVVASARAAQTSPDEQVATESLSNPPSLFNISSLRSDIAEPASIGDGARSASSSLSSKASPEPSERSDLAEQAAKSQAAHTTSAIKSRYRVRANKVRFSQPLEVESSTKPDGIHQSLARALPASYSSPVVYSDPAARLLGSNYLVEPAASQRISSQDEPRQAEVSEYLPPVQPHQTSNYPAAPVANQRLVSPRLRTSQALASLSSDTGPPYYATSPVAATLSDYLEAPPVDPQLSAGDHYDHYGSAANLSDIHSTAPYYSSSPLVFPPPPLPLPLPPPLLHAPPSPYYTDEHYLPASSGRSRWSWPWSDTSGGALTTSGTFKKHFFQHHQPAHVKEQNYHHHHDNDEHDHLMHKWEHGVSIGEVACVAVAVVLGVIILGSPFFLLFLMLFNGGNLFGSTQMGLLAPASAQAAAAALPASGRRRRKRSVDGASGGGGGGGDDGLGGNDQVKDVPSVDRVGEFLLDQLSPLLQGDKLLRTLGHIMNIKADFERIMAKLSQHGQDAKFESGQIKRKSQHAHVEMRRRRRK